jgi:hypothetical protein
LTAWLTLTDNLAVTLKERVSACAIEAQENERARLRDMTSIERMNSALRAGRIAKYFAEEGMKRRARNANDR